MTPAPAEVTLLSLERMAREAIANRERMRETMGSAFDGPAELALVLRRRSPPRGTTVRLAGRFGPRGEVLCCPSDHEVTAMFKADEVLAFVARARAEVARPA